MESCRTPDVTVKSFKVEVVMTTSTLKDFTDDVTVHEVVASVSDCQLLQDDLSSLHD